MRFSCCPDRTKIRINQGHSVEVNLELEAVEPPEILFHGTVEKFLESIMSKGLQKMNRQQVHMSAAYETAVIVGQRRGKPVALAIDAGKMYIDGYSFFISKNGVWLTELVKPEYLSRFEY